MAFFEDLGKKLSATGQSAAQKTKELAEVTKLKSQVNDLNKSLNSYYQEIGKLYFEKTKDAPDAEFEGLYAQIAEAYEKLESTKAQIREIKGINICSNCGEEVPAGQKFCSKCGTEIIAEVPETEEQE